MFAGHVCDDAHMAAPTAESLGSIFADPVAYADPGRWHAAARRIREESPVLRVALPDFPGFWAADDTDGQAAEHVTSDLAGTACSVLPSKQR